MSMILELLEITPETFTYLSSDLDAFEEFLDREWEIEKIREDLDKAWHGIHFLLTGSPWEGEAPLNFLLKGGVEFGHDQGYGAPRYLSPEAVSSVSTALEAIPPGTFRSRFDSDLLDQNQIYPTGWSRPEEKDSIREYLVSSYRILRSSIDVVRHRGNGLVLYLT
jgi:hypothetical protein